MALKLIDNTELGVLLFAYNIILFIIPIGGFGLHQSLIRFGALSNNKEDKNIIFNYVFKKGILASFGLIALIIIAAFFIPFEFKNARNYVIGLSFIIIPSFILETIKAHLRLNYNNKSFAISDVVYSSILLLSIVVFSYFFNTVGYAFALFLAPTITCFLFFKKININKNITKKLPILNTEFWKYGFFASLSNVVTQLLFAIDILLIGYLLKEEILITNYRYLTLIPFSILFLPRIFITTDFVKITEQIFNKSFLINYIKSYLILFTIISLVLILFCWFLAPQILTIFDASYAEYIASFRLLIIGVTGIFIFRNLFGNLLSAIGKAKLNFYIALVSLVINILLNIYLIPKYGILGAAITTASLMWFSGILSVIIFAIYYKNLSLKKL